MASHFGLYPHAPADDPRSQKPNKSGCFTNSCGEPDYLQIVHCLVWIAGIVVVVSAIILAVENRSSRSLALATGAVVGGVVAFLIQASFELTSASRSDHISFAYTFDLASKELRQWDYTKLDVEMLTGRLSTETEAGKWIFKINPSVDEPAGEAVRRKVVSDLALLSTAAFFGQVERDWQWSYKKYNSPALGFSISAPLSKRLECSMISEQEIRAKLREAGNLFADAPSNITLNGICLPPGTALDVSSTSLVLRNPIFTVVLEIEDPGGVSFIQPGSSPAKVAELADGRPRFENHIRGLNIEIKFSSLRANHPLRGRYEEWSKRLVERLSLWFACC